MITLPDPGSVRRLAMRNALAAKLPDFEVLIGGATTIDVTRRGVDKSYGVKWLAAHLRVEPKDMFYIGDAFSETGNDAVVIPTGVRTRVTSGPEETGAIIEEIL